MSLGGVSWSRGFQFFQTRIRKAEKSTHRADMNHDKGSGSAPTASPVRFYFCQSVEKPFPPSQGLASTCDSLEDVERN